MTDLPDITPDQHATPALAKELKRAAHRATDAAVRGHLDATIRPIIRQALEQAAGGKVDADTEAEYLWIVQAEIDRLRRALDQARFACEALLIANTRDHGAIRLGDTVYRATEDRRRKLHDKDAAAAYVAAQGGSDALQAIWRLDDGNIRWGALAAHIERWAEDLLAAGDAPAPTDDETLEEAIQRARADTIQMITDTLWSWEDGPKGGLQLSAAPVSKAKWSQALEHGQRDPSRKPCIGCEKNADGEWTMNPDCPRHQSTSPVENDTSDQ